MSTASEIARRHFEAALAEGGAASHAPDTLARAMLSLVVETWLKERPVADVRAEILAAADNVDPDTDYAFMRP
ncbi:MAG: hypothetical protein H6923_07750 [Alphaproteobacteria bacterium]|nr:hypothetical protein [Alphaproteobacteria bacterium]